jgi:sacsin
MTFIGHSDLESRLITHQDMGESLTSRIKNVLVEYDVKQAFTEFLANAADAKATDFGITLDERCVTAHHVLSPAFAQFAEVKTPYLTIFNNSVFKETDWDGILDTGIGGKANESDTIGRFGLGALSMFHFTDVSSKPKYRTP